MGQKSALGGVEIEGVVVKNHRQFGADDKPLMAKVVRDGFKELNSGEWRLSRLVQSSTGSGQRQW
jgi:hypothetical protein